MTTIYFQIARKRIFAAAGMALFLAVSLSGAGAQQGGTATTLRLDPARTEIHYTAGSSLHRVRGSFALKGGMLAFDPATGVAQGQILVDAASGHSGDKKLDAKMQGEVLESGKYPELFFHPEKMTGKLKEGTEQKLTLIGSFNMHGADHPLKVDAMVTLHGEEAVAKVEFDVPYVDWGMKDASTLLLHARTVHISVSTHAAVEVSKPTQ